MLHTGVTEYVLACIEHAHVNPQRTGRGFPAKSEDTASAAAKSLQSCPTLRPHRQRPTRVPHPWDSPGKNTGVGCHFLLQCMKVQSESEVAQSCPTLSDPMDCSLPGSSVHGIFQTRVLEWGAIAFSAKENRRSKMHSLNMHMQNSEEQAFFIVQLSHPYMTTGKNIALTRWTFVDKVMSLLFNILSRSLPRSNKEHALKAIISNNCRTSFA